MLECFEILGTNSQRVGADQTIIGRAAVATARMAEEGKAPSNIGLWNRLISSSLAETSGRSNALLASRVG